MPSDQTLIFAIFAAVFVLLIHGRVRYDLVAFGALVLAAILGLVESEALFWASRTPLSPSSRWC